jgi:predicted nucleic acid-binding protein
MILLQEFVAFAMNGKIKMQSVQIYLDTNVFIEMFETRSPASSLLWDLFGRAYTSGITFISSELTLAEILVRPIAEAHKTQNWRQVSDYREQIADKDGFQTIAPVSRDVLDYAANIRALVKGVKLPDAIHLATAVIQKCDFFLSNDRPLADRVLNATPRFPIRQFVHFHALAGYDFTPDKL